jgi:hypothetical protein
VPHRFTKLALVATALVIGACSATVAESDAPSRLALEPPNDPVNGGAAGPSCTPEVIGLVPTTQGAIAVECPSGWQRRDGSTPISGRFKSHAELVDALCVATDDANTDPRSTKEDLGIDFAYDDVFATPYEASSRTLPSINKRSSSEIWVRVTGSCSGGAKATFATALFVVPKDAKVDEQRCNVACQ